VRFLSLDEGEDPDDTVQREGRAGFEQRMQAAATLADFFVDHLQAEHNTDTVGGSAQLVESATGYLSDMPAGVYHELLVERLANTVGLDPARLRSGMSLQGRSNAARHRERRQHRHGPERLKFAYTSMRRAISLLMQVPELIERLPGDHPALASDQPGTALLANLHACIAADPNISTARLIERWRDTPEYNQLQQLLERPVEFDQEGATEQLFDQALHGIAERGRATRYQQLLDIAQERRLSEDEKQEMRTLTQTVVRAGHCPGGAPGP